MLLSIPVSDLLNSQLEVGIDPLNGNMTYNVKDTPSGLQHGDGVGNLILTLQTSPLDGRLRICTNSTTDSTHQSMDAFQGVFIRVFLEWKSVVLWLKHGDNNTKFFHT